MTRPTSLSVALLFPFIAAGGVACSSVPEPTSAPSSLPVPDAAPGFFSADQAARGRQSYRESCSECHATSEFRGTDFEWSWRRQTAWDLYTDISENMPEDKPGELSDKTYADIVAYLLSLNGYQMGSRDLASKEKAMAAIPLGAGVQKTVSKE